MRKFFAGLGFLVAAALLFIYQATSPSKTDTPKVYDCFLFYNEFELLEMRFHELYDHVDKFVIVEAAETFRGKPKEMLFQKNQSRFAPFADKIIYVPILDRFETDDQWKREIFQRNQILRGLKECHANDVILISDVDEIIAGSVIQSIKTSLETGEKDLVVCSQHMYSGYLNRFRGFWPGSVGSLYGRVRAISPNGVRELRNLPKRSLRKAKISRPELLKNAGWHFSSVGGIHRLIAKIEAFSHAELDTPEFKNEENLLKEIKQFPLVEINELFPRFVREHQEHLEKIGFIDRDDSLMEASSL